MSHYRPPNSSYEKKPPPYYPHHHPHRPPHHPPHYPPPYQSHPQSYPYYVSGTAMIPVPIRTPPPPTPTTEPPAQTSYVTNYIYQGESSNGPPVVHQVQIVETGDFDWVPTTAETAHRLNGKAVLGGQTGGRPTSSLWVIRAWYNGDLIPGKLSVRDNAASVVYGGKEIPVQHIEVLCAKPENLKWVPAANGDVPAGAIAGGHTSTGETLYVGRARDRLLSTVPGKVHPSHNCCYISYAGKEVSFKNYDVLTRI